MALAIAHFAFGLSATSLLVALIAPRLRFQRTVLFLGGIWGLIPDLYRGFPDRSSPAIVHSLDSAPWGDLFFFHRRLDVLSTEDSPEFAAAVIGISLCVVVASEVIGYLQPIVVRAARERIGGARNAQREKL